MNESVPEQLNYSKTPKVCPYYAVRKVLPQVSQTVAIGNSSQETIFELPPVVFNLAKSTLYLTCVFPAKASLANYVPADTFPYIRQIQLYTRGDVMICDLNDVANYLKVIYPPTTNLETMDSVSPSAFQADDTLGIYTGGLYKSNALVANNLMPDGGSTTVNYVDYRRVWQSSDQEKEEPFFRIGFKLENIKDTIFSVNKDLLFNETIYMKIIWNPYTKVYWRATDEDSPSVGATAADAGFYIDEISLYLQVEKNPLIVSQIQQSVASGNFEMIIPYTRSYKQQFGAVGVQNINYKFNRSDGARILKIWHSVFLAADSANKIYDNSAVTSAYAPNQKIKTFHTELNNERIQPFEIATRLYLDYMLLKDSLNGSAVLNALSYSTNWFWVDVFDSQDKLCDEEHYNELCGLSLDQEVKWDFASTTAETALIHYTFVNFQRYLKIDSQGVFIV